MMHPEHLVSKSLTIGSFVKLFKLVIIIAFVKYGCINKFEVACRSRGLIYNRDGKFIYKPARPNQGHIIVIDDRHRDQKAEAPSMSSESSYQPIQLISPRVFHPSTQLSSRDLLQNGLVRLVNLNELQSIARLQPSPSDPRAGALLARSPTIQVLPVLQVYQPPLSSRPNSNGYNYPQTGHSAGFSNEYEEPEQPLPSVDMHNYRSAPIQPPRIYEVDSPIGVYDQPPGIHPSPSASNYNDETLVKGARMGINRFNQNRKPRRASPGEQNIDQYEDLEPNRSDLYEGSGNLRIATLDGPPMVRRPSKGSIADATGMIPSASGITQVANPDPQHLNSRLKSASQVSERGTKPAKKNLIIKSKSPDAKKSITNQTGSNESFDSDIRNTEDSIYWKQFRDRFEILN